MADKEPVTIRLCPDARAALYKLAYTIERLPTTSQFSVTNLKRTELLKYRDMVNELRTAAETHQPMEYEKAQEIVCSLKAARDGSVNGSSILYYGLNQAKGYSMYGNTSKVAKPSKYISDKFGALTSDLTTAIEENGFDYDGFMKIQKPLRAQQSHAVPYRVKQAAENNANMTFTAEQVKTLFNKAITAYKQVQGDYTAINAQNNPVVRLYVTARDELMQSESCTYAQISKNLTAKVNAAAPTEDWKSLKTAKNSVLSLFYKAHSQGQGAGASAGK